MDLWEGVWVVLAAYNEKQSIGGVLEQLSQLPCRVVVVDDGSSDGTSAAALEHPVILLSHTVNLGQGAALQTGIRYVLQQSGSRIIVTFDADGQHDPEDISRLVAPVAAGDVDVALGTRFAAGARVADMPAARRRMLKLAVAFTRWSTGLKVSDTHNGLRALSAEAARQINITANRMAHATEILSQIRKKKLKYVEVPVNVRYTQYSLAKGQSLLEAVNVLWDIFSGDMR